MPRKGKRKILLTEEEKELNRRHQRALRKARSRKQKLKEKPEYDGELYDIEHPSQEYIKAECLKLQSSWNEIELISHMHGIDCDPFNVPMLTHYYVQLEQDKKDKSVSEGRFQRLNKPWHSNGNLIREEADYHGDNLYFCDSPYWNIESSL